MGSVGSAWVPLFFFVSRALVGRRTGVGHIQQKRRRRRAVQNYFESHCPLEDNESSNRHRVTTKKQTCRAQPSSELCVLGWISLASVRVPARWIPAGM